MKNHLRSQFYYAILKVADTKEKRISYPAVPMARASFTTRRTPRRIIQSPRVSETIESFGKRVLRDFKRWLLAGRNLRLQRRAVRLVYYRRDPSRLYIIAILRPTERTVSKLTELARKLGMICTASSVSSLFAQTEKRAS